MEEETDFGWALAKMRDGYAVRRKEWPAHWRWDMDTEHTMIRHHGGGQIATVPVVAALAYDWELAD